MKDDPLATIAEIRKEKFVQLVERLAGLRSLQYGESGASSGTDGCVGLAQKVEARNLPSNLLRAAVIFVDYIYGFPPRRGSFSPPTWATSNILLPETERGRLECSGFKDIIHAEEGDAVVLLEDSASNQLHAGMAGIVREVCEDDSMLVEFGEPQQSVTIQAKITRSSFRTPRPGDFRICPALS